MFSFPVTVGDGGDEEWLMDHRRCTGLGEENAGLVLITGGTGFIGCRVIETLRTERLSIRVLTRDKAKAAALWPEGTVAAASADLKAPDTIGDICSGARTLIHLAGYAHGDDNDGVGNGIHEQVTVNGTRALLDAAVRSGVQRVVFVSSVKAMGESTQGCVDEKTDSPPTTSYGKAKRKAELAVLETGKKHNMHVSIVRLPLVYGPGVKGNLLRMIELIDRGFFPPPPDVKNQRSMIHVQDVVQALLLVAGREEANGKVYLVTDGENYTTQRIYRAIRLALGRKVPRWSVPKSVLQLTARLGDAVASVRGRPFFFNSHVYDKLFGTASYSNERIRRELGFTPRQTLENALPEMIAQYRKV